MVAAIALLLLAALWGPLCAEENAFCIDQPEALQVRDGESVTIPCRFSYNRTLVGRPKKPLSVHWRAGDGGRCGSSNFIYNHTDEYTAPEYGGRISLVGDPEKRSCSIQIDRLLESDAKRKYCCRIEVTLQNGSLLGWQNRHMTRLMFAGVANEPQVYQPDAIPALVGSSATIPCGFTYPGVSDPTNDFNIDWKVGHGDLCLDFNQPSVIYNKTVNYTHRDYQHRISLVEDPRGNGTSSLHIERLKESDSRRYCCVVTKTTGKRDVIQSSHGTELIVGDLKPIAEFAVTQSGNITAQRGENIAMNCSFKHPEGRDPLWIGVYWMVGGQWGKFVYHPSKESIDPSYRGRTSLSGDPALSSTVSLQITEVDATDNVMYYCLVVFRFCKSNNNFSSVMQQGPGTRLQVEGAGFPTILVVIAAVIVLLLFAIVIVLVLKRKGIIGKGAKAVDKPTASVADIHLETLSDSSKDSQPPVRPNVSPRSNVPEVEDGVLYAALDMTKPRNVTPTAHHEPQNETLYSAVRTK
ncbi:sialic acid-binding Ig-like lectin 9 [Ambystoma mexicanum]|uniref:sialic acid-binding Ig-like lectin 9 n=1 Tax=Ambystoma mexicanum TaxID=8296 RepID=UPI0037E75A00